MRTNEVIKDELSRLNSPIAKAGMGLILELENAVDLLLACIYAYHDNPKKLKDICLKIAGDLDVAIREFTEEVMEAI